MSNKVLSIIILVATTVGLFVYFYFYANLNGLLNKEPEATPYKTPPPRSVFPGIINTKTTTEAKLDNDLKEIIWPEAENVSVQSTVYENQKRGFMLSYVVKGAGSSTVKDMHNNFGFYLFNLKWTFVSGEEIDAKARMEFKKDNYIIRIILTQGENKTVKVETEIMEL